jgi:dTDP-4-dehydrorhamnose 3,5-epimerase
MQVETIFIDGPLVITPKVFKDPRGYFMESYNKQSYSNIGIDLDYVQDNQSLSEKGILRGLHFQAPPFDQGKLVRVIKGAVLDVIVDIRKNSPTYGKHYAIELTEDNFKTFWVPSGFAHGFTTLADHTIFSYKCTNYYNQASEGGLMWNDPDLGIDWGIQNPILSDKDTKNALFKDFISPF